MKKFLLFIGVIIGVAVVSVGVTYGVNLQEDLGGVQPVFSIEDDESFEEDSKLTFTITAIGDCTLGTDVSFGTVGTLVSEANAKNNDYSYFLRNVRKYFKKDDLTIANFEGTLSYGGVRSPKKFAFRGNPDYVGILYGSYVEAVNLANNHTMDYGHIAYNDTVQTMQNFGITPFGMDSIAVYESKGIRVGLIGINALNRASRQNFSKLLDELKKLSPDLIVASFHWGVEKAGYPNRDQVSLAHDAIDRGVDLVIGHHPHVLQGVEKYKDKYIVYSLGNFCFGGNKNPVDKDTMIFRQTFIFKDGQLLSAEAGEIIPCSVSSVANRNNYQPTPLSGNNFERAKQKIISRSAGFSGIENIKFIENRN